MLRMYVTGLYSFLVFLCLQFAAVAEFVPEKLLDPDTAIAAASEVNVNQYPNADTVLVDNYCYIRYREDGTFVQWDDNYVKILTEKGKREWQTISSYFTIPYNTTEFKTVEIIKADGSIVPVDHEAASREMVNPSQMGSNIYNPNSRILQLSIPNLEVGDTLHYVLFDDFVTTRVPNTWSDHVVFESTAPIKRKTYEVVAPAELPLQKIMLRAEIDGAVQYSKKEISAIADDGAQEQLIQYRWVAQDVAQIFPEPGMPAYHTVVQRLLVSTIPEWETVSRWYWNLSKPHLDAVSPEMEQKVAELVRGLTDDRAKIEAIFYWVSQNIRYLGITTETTAPGYEPHPVSACFAQRHGVCRDKAALLVAMLRMAGFDAYPVLIHNGPKKDEDVPTPFFNHAISAVQMPNGEYMLMDSTDENTKELLPGYLNNQSYLVAKPEGETLKTSNIVPAEENLMVIETTGTLNAEGDWLAESTLHFNGINDNAYRGYFSKAKPHERRRLFEGQLKDAAVGAQILDLEMQPENMLNTAVPLQVKIHWTAPKLPVTAGNMMMLPVPKLGTDIGMVNFVLGKVGLNKRQYPLRTEIACGVREILTINLADAVREAVAIPEYREIDNDMLTRRQKLSLQDGKLRIQSDFLLKTVEFSPQQYAELKDILKVMEFENRKTPIFKISAKPEISTAGADVELLDLDTRYDVVDEHNWTETRKVRKKILTYAGKKEQSDLRFSFNEGWEDVDLIEAKVTAPDGSVKTISDEEINLMDASWLGQAARYPAGRTMVASLPGVEVGSIIEYTVVQSHRNKPFFAAMEYFRTTEPLLKKTVRITLPENMDLRVLKDDDGIALDRNASDLPQPVITEVQTKLNGNKIYIWKVKDVAAVQTENQLPPWWTFNPVVFASAGDWTTYAAHIRDILLTAATDQVETQKKAAELVDGLALEREKIGAVRDFVARYIRQAGPSFSGLPLSAVTPADQTLAEGYGNTTDRAVLFHALLSAAGFDPEFVLTAAAPEVSALQKPLKEIADPNWFNSLLVRIDSMNETIYLNDTDQYDNLGATPHDGVLGFVLTSAAFETIHATASSRDSMEVDYSLEVAADGSAVVTKKQRLYGIGYGRAKKKFAEMPPEELSRYFQETVSAISQRAIAVSDLQTNFAGYPGTVEFEVKIDQFAVRDGEYLYFKLFDTLQYLMNFRADQRHNPIYWPETQDFKLSYKIKLPEGYDVVLPELPDVNSNTSSETILTWNAPEQNGNVAVVPSKTENGDLHILYDVHLKPAFLSAARYHELLEIDQRLDHPSASTILLKKMD